MRAPLVAATVLSSVLLVPTSAEATIKLCIRTGTPIVPVNPTYILEQDQDDSFTSKREQATPPPPRLPRTSTPYGAYWKRVTVEAPHGTKLYSNYERVHASADWKRPDDTVRVVHAFSSGEASGLFVDFEHANRMLQATRVEWAIDRSALGTDLAALQVDYPGVCHDDEGRVYIPTHDDFRVLYVRLTPLLYDGSEGTPWEGWFVRDPVTNEVRFGTGEAPAREPARQCGEPQAPRVVGARPSFEFAASERTFRAITPDGRRLATAVRSIGGHTEVTVDAHHGDRFQLEMLPLGSVCPIDVEVVELDRVRPRAPSPVTPPCRGGSQGVFALLFAVAAAIASRVARGRIAD